jgi:hypothetical protein
MRKLLLVVPFVLLFASCANFTWKHQPPKATDVSRQEGVAKMASQHETEAFWRSVRARRDGRVNAWGRDMMAIQDTLDRAFFNYSTNDPSLMYSTDRTIVDHTLGFGAMFLAR